MSYKTVQQHKFKRDGKDISRKVNQKKVEMATLTSARVDLE